MASGDGEGPSAAFALRQNQSKKHKKNYLLPRAYLVKENLTRCGGWFDLSNMFSILSFYFSFTPARDTNCLHFAREVLWLSEQRNGVRGLLAKSVT